MLIVVNAIFSMFSFCKLLYLYMFRCGAREAVRVLLVFPQIAQICADAVRVLLVLPQIAQMGTDAVRGGLIPQIAPRRGRCHRCRSGCFLFSRRLRRFAQMPFGVFLVFPQIAQICTDARSGRFLFSTQIAPLAPRCKREFCYNVTCYMLQ